jgi:hypothetical protein
MRCDVMRCGRIEARKKIQQFEKDFESADEESMRTYLARVQVSGYLSVFVSDCLSD